VTMMSDCDSVCTVVRTTWPTSVSSTPFVRSTSTPAGSTLRSVPTHSIVISVVNGLQCDCTARSQLLVPEFSGQSQK